MAAPSADGMMPVTLRPLAVLALALTAAACAAEVPWRNPNLPKQQWAKDWNNCKRQSGDGFAAFHEDDPSPSQFRDYDRAQTKKQIDAQMSMCMRELGYTPAPRKDD
jgi:hypothetical protein